MPTISPGTLGKSVRDLLEEENKKIVTAAVMADIVDSLQAVVGTAIENGDSVNLFNLVKVSPVGVPAKKAQKNVTNPRTGEVGDVPARPANVKAKATALKLTKAALPEADSAVGKKLIKVVVDRRKAAAERAAAKAAEEEKASSKSSKKKTGAKKKKKK